MIDEDPNEFQKRIARIQIWSSVSIGFGGVALGIGASMWFTATSLSGAGSTIKEIAEYQTRLANSFDMMGIFFVFLGATFLIAGLLLPMHMLRRKSEKKLSDLTMCFCGNKLPCSIHLS